MEAEGDRCAQKKVRPVKKPARRLSTKMRPMEGRRRCRSGAEGLAL